MTYGAFGLVEVLGEANAVLVLDRMLRLQKFFMKHRIQSAADMP